MELTDGVMVIWHVYLVVSIDTNVTVFCKHYTPPETYFCYFRNNNYT